MRITTHIITVLYELDEDGYYVASVPALTGCYTQGKTLEEAQQRIKEVIELCLENESDSERPHSFPQFVGVQQLHLT